MPALARLALTVSAPIRLGLGTFLNLPRPTVKNGDQRLSPFLGIGIGRFRNFPNQSLVGATDTDANLANATVGVRYYLTERFVLRADYTLYTAFVSDQRSQEFRAVSAGLSFFFY